MRLRTSDTSLSAPTERFDSVEVVFAQMGKAPNDHLCLLSPSAKAFRATHVGRPVLLREELLSESVDSLAPDRGDGTASPERESPRSEASRNSRRATPENARRAPLRASGPRAPDRARKAGEFVMGATAASERTAARGPHCGVVGCGAYSILHLRQSNPRAVAGGRLSVSLGNMGVSA